MFVLFFFFICEAKKKKSTQRKRNHAGFLRLRFAQPFRDVRLRRISFASQTCATHFKQCSAIMKFRAYWSEQSMLARQLQGKLCLTVGSLLALSRALQLISERKSSSERFFVLLSCRYKKVAIYWLI